MTRWAGRQAETPVAALLAHAPSTGVTLRGSRYTLLPLRGAALGCLGPLLRSTYSRRDFTAEWLERKYAGEFGGVSAFSYVALTAEGQPVATCGMLPWPIRFGDRVEIGVQVVDVATHRDHRRRGLFRRLADLAQARCVEQGASFFFAFPHRGGDSYPGFVGTLGYTDVGVHTEYRRSIRTLWLERFTKRAGLNAWYRRRLDSALEQLEPADATLANSLVGEGFAGTDRTAAFYAYKAFAGSRVLQLDGGRVWLKVRHGVQIGDIEAHTEREIERTMRSLATLAARVGAHRLALHAATDSGVGRFLANRWRSATSVSVVYRDAGSAIPAERLRFSLGDLDNF